jgi:hypothetical protein
MKKFFIILSSCFLLVMSPKFTVFAEVISDNFESLEDDDADWVEYINLVPYTHKLLNNAVLNGKKILARDVVSLDNGTVVYRAHGVQTLKVKIFHGSGTFATWRRDDQNPEGGMYILGSEIDPCRDPFKVYYCKKDDKLYLNHLNKEWRECYHDSVLFYQFKKSNSEFKAENFGQDLVFYGVNVYTSTDNFEFKIVPDCTIESAEHVRLFGGDGNYLGYYCGNHLGYYCMEVLSFSIPENVTCIKVVLSNFERYYLNDGSRYELKPNPEKKQKTFIFLANIDLIGDKIDLDYYGDPGKPANEKTIRIKEKKPKKVKEPKPAKEKKEKREKVERVEKKKEVEAVGEAREDKKVQKISEATHSDVATVDPEPAVDEAAASPESEAAATKPIKEKKGKKTKAAKKDAPRKKRKPTKKPAEKDPAPQNEEKVVFLRTDSNRQKELPQSNKLFSTSYVASAGGVALCLAFEDHLKTLVSKVLSYLHKFRR